MFQLIYYKYTHNYTYHNYNHQLAYVSAQLTTHSKCNCWRMPCIKSIDRCHQGEYWHTSSTLTSRSIDKCQQVTRVSIFSAHKHSIQTFSVPVYCASLLSSDLISFDDIPWASIFLIAAWSTLMACYNNINDNYSRTCSYSHSYGIMTHNMSPFRPCISTTC